MDGGLDLASTEYRARPRASVVVFEYMYTLSQTGRVLLLKLYLKIIYCATPSGKNPAHSTTQLPFRFLHLPLLSSVGILSTAAGSATLILNENGALGDVAVGSNDNGALGGVALGSDKNGALALVCGRSTQGEPEMKG